MDDPMENQIDQFLLDRGPDSYTINQLTRHILMLEKVVAELADRLTKLDGRVLRPVATCQGLGVGSIIKPKEDDDGQPAH